MLEPIIDGTVSQRGTFNGHPLSVAAANACLDHLAQNAGDIYPRMETYARTIAEHVRDTARRTGAEVAANQAGPCVQLFAGTRAVPTLSDLASVDKERTLDLTGALLARGVATLPRGMMYLSAAHTESDIDATLGALTEAIETIR